ncbi:alpha-tubulin-specific protease, partial [Shigella sonnei]
MQTSNITNHERNDSSWMSTVKSTTEVSWNKLSFCDVLLKIITFGIYSPHETLAEKYSEKKLMDSFSPSLSQDKMDGEFAHANIDGISIRLCLNKGICSVFYLDGDKIQSTQLSSKEYNNLLSSLPPKQFNLGKVHTITAPVSGNFKTHKPAPEVIETAINCCTSIIPNDDYFPVKDTDFNSVWHDIYRDIRASNSNSTKIYFNNIEIPLKLIADLINELGINEFIDSKKELQMLSYNQVNKIINSNFPQQDLCFQTEKLLFTSLFQDPAFISALT